MIFTVLSFILLTSAGMVLASGIDSFKKEAPGKGGELHEGVVGSPNFINPLLSSTSSGKDLSYLIYSGLMRIDGDGKFVPDLAESYELSPDGTTYTFILREDLFFHDNKPITSADVVFTIEKAQDSGIKSVVAPNWQGVEVKAVDEQTVQFILKDPYTPFIENTTLGIIPKHIWENADLNQFTFSAYNFEPIGSGPYMIREVARDTSGAAKYYKLGTFKRYPGGAKNISSLFIHIYPTAEELLTALKSGAIQSAADIAPQNAVELADEGYIIQTADLLRIFGVFFNQNQATLFTDKNVRTALELAVDRKQIIDTVLYGYGNEEFTPLPGHTLQTFEREGKDTSAARALLERNGWIAGTDGILEKKSGTATTRLAFTLTTSTNSELAKASEILKQQWREIGAEVTITTLDPAELSADVIRPRKYDALLFGEITGRGNDLYPFWHSSERKDPGLNIALYTNSSADRLLERARTAISSEEIARDLESFKTIVAEDVPAIFLYSPKLIYVLPEKVRGVGFPALELSSERWIGIFSSYINAKRVWK